MNAHLTSQLVVAAILFVVGLIGFLTRRNLIVMMLCAELMLHAVSLNLTAFGQFHQSSEGQSFTIFVLTVAACEAGLALALILSLYQRRKSLDVSLWGKLGEGERPAISSEPARPVEPEDAENYPHLTPAGRMPRISSRGFMTTKSE